MAENILHKATYFITVTDPYKLPDSIAEVAFVGRSNVGKSSLLNALCEQKKLAHTSQTKPAPSMRSRSRAATGLWIFPATALPAAPLKRRKNGPP